jgi:glycosyltransferase involved in cell wall biosynthesis
MGSERCVESFTNIWKDADVFTLVDFLTDEEREIILKGKKANTSIIQKLPFAKKLHRNYFPFFPYAIEQLDVSNYDVIISSSHSFAKGVITSANQLHISYCHTPIRYAWDLYHQYIDEAGLKTGIRGILAKKFLHYIRIWDFTTRNRVDYFVANSSHIARRIKKVYDKPADVIYPPVDIDKFSLVEKKEDYYLTAARFVPYKKIVLIVEAFSKMPDKKLIVIGDGPEEKKIKQIASSNIKFAGYVEKNKLIEYMQNAKAFIFAAEEDFGITNVEAQACGTPVIAYKVGGASDTIVHNKTGYLFSRQNPEAIINAVAEFENNESKFIPKEISKHAEKFSRSIFEANIKNYVLEKANSFFNQPKY